MIEKYEIELEEAEVSKRVRSIIGVPDGFLEDDVISSSVFIKQTENFINKNIKDYYGLIEDTTLLDICSMYYISYLLCVGMEARLPHQMENLSTKTILQTINWDEKALELLDKAKEILDDFLEEFEDDDYYGTIIDISDEMEYPEINI